jgi:quinoprotein glucose dehydrogenase
MTAGGRRIKALAQPTKQAFLFVLNRETGEPIWPIEERRVPQSSVPKEKTSPTQPFPTRPAPFDRQGIGVDDLIDFTPALRAEALEVIKRFQAGPMYTPPVLSDAGGPVATLQVPSDHGGANWPGGALDPETNRLFIHSHTAVFAVGIVPADPATSDMGYVSGIARAGAAPAVPAGEGADAGEGGRGGGRGRAGAAAGSGAAGGRGRAVTTVQGLPLIKPPYDRITAYDMNTGDLIWQKTHSSTPTKSESSGTARARPAAARPVRPHVHRRAGDQDAADRGRGWRSYERRRPARRPAARLRQGDRRGRGRRGHAGEADGIAA